jgi:hypothetical protein
MALRHTPHAILLVAVLALLAVLVFGSPSQAQESGTVHTVYLSVTGEGPNAKAWYNGAPPTGLLVQEALDRWSEKGYRVKEVRPYLRPFVTVVSPDQGTVPQTNQPDESFVILMEKVGP